MIEVIKSGLATSVQDLGRNGFAAYGVPQSGTMDRYSAKIANLLVGNSENDALLEITQLGPKLKFHAKALVAVSGLKAEIRLNEERIQMNEPFVVEKGADLEIKRITSGTRAYLSVFGGLQTKMMLGSRSMYEGVTAQSRIKKGDFLTISAFMGSKVNSLSSIRFEREDYATNKIIVFPGPEFDLLSEKSKDDLIHNEFTISNDSNRMAYLVEEKLVNKLKSILTGPVVPGTVQLTAGGKLILLMCDCQVTGGYPRVLQLSEKSMNVLAQKKAGEKIMFELFSNP